MTDKTTYRVFCKIPVIFDLEVEADGREDAEAAAISQLHRMMKTPEGFTRISEKVQESISDTLDLTDVSVIDSEVV